MLVVPQGSAHATYMRHTKRVPEDHVLVLNIPAKTSTHATQVLVRHHVAQHVGAAVRVSARPHRQAFVSILVGEVTRGILLTRRVLRDPQVVLQEPRALQHRRTRRPVVERGVARQQFVRCGCPRPVGDVGVDDLPVPGGFWADGALGGQLTPQRSCVRTERSAPFVGVRVDWIGCLVHEARHGKVRTDAARTAKYLVVCTQDTRPRTTFTSHTVLFVPSTAISMRTTQKCWWMGAYRPLFVMSVPQGGVLPFGSPPVLRMPVSRTASIHPHIHPPTTTHILVSHGR